MMRRLFMLLRDLFDVDTSCVAERLEPAMKDYPLRIWTCLGCYAASWGHHDPSIFVISLAADNGVCVPPGAHVKHGYARLGFDPFDKNGRVISNAKGAGRGVRPITECRW